MPTFKTSDMHDVGNKPISIKAERNRKYYPSIDLTAKKLKKLNQFNFGQDVTIHAHGKITGTHQYNDEPKRFTIELEKIGIKSGHNPKALERKLKAQARKKGYTGKRADAYVYGTLRKTGWIPSTQKKKRKVAKEWRGR